MSAVQCDHCGYWFDPKDDPACYDFGEPECERCRETREECETDASNEGRP